MPASEGKKKLNRRENIYLKGHCIHIKILKKKQKQKNSSG
jgi:hypothetical protein